MPDVSGPFLRENGTIPIGGLMATEVKPYWATEVQPGWQMSSAPEGNGTFGQMSSTYCDLGLGPPLKHKQLISTRAANEFNQSATDFNRHGNRVSTHGQSHGANGFNTYS